MRNSISISIEKGALCRDKVRSGRIIGVSKVFPFSRIIEFYVNFYGKVKVSNILILKSYVNQCRIFFQSCVYKSGSKSMITKVMS